MLNKSILARTLAFGNAYLGLAIVFMLFWATIAPASAWETFSTIDPSKELLPVADGMVMDNGAEVGGPPDGIPDYVEEELGLQVVHNSLTNHQAVIEFDLGTVEVGRIQRILLNVVPIGYAWQEGTIYIPIQLFGFAGDGSIQLDDFDAGSFITVFDVPIRSREPIFFDVTDEVIEILLSQHSLAGFNLRTSVDAGSVNFGSLEHEPSPTLIIEYIPTPVAAITIKKAHVRLWHSTSDRFEVIGSCELGENSDGIDVLNEDVTVVFDGFVQTIPAGAFISHDDEGEFEFCGASEGIQKMEIEIEEDGKLKFQVKAAGLDLNEINLDDPVSFTLSIGDDVAETAIPFNHRGWYLHNIFD